MARVILDIPIKEKQVVCPNCGHTIGYVKNDIQEYHGTDYSGGPDGQEWVNCPHTSCGKKIILRSW